MLGLCISKLYLYHIPFHFILPLYLVGTHLEVWQLCCGMDENAVGTCSELIFAPIDASFADDAPLLPSGFRIIPLDSGKVGFQSLFSSFILSISLCFIDRFIIVRLILI